MNQNKKPTRVLHVIDGLGSGGAESLIMGWYRNMDREKVQFDFLIRSENNNYDEEIRKLGGHVYVAPSFPKHWLSNYRFTKALLKKKTYKIIHVHGNALMYVYALVVGKKLNIPCRIMHSHNTSTAKKIYYPIHHFNKYRIHKFVNMKLACSKDAGEWMFGKKDYDILENGIVIENFIYRQEIREDYRKQMNLTNKFVVGNVARFLPSKNHAFLLQVFNEIAKLDSSAVLLLVGEGKDKENIAEEATKLGLIEKIHFMGVRKDINYLMQSMDVFVLPSNFEGLGIVLVEAQFAGLPCIASNVIPKESRVSDLIEYISLDSSPKYWAESILKHRQSERNDLYLNRLNYSYDIKVVAKKLEKIYLKCLN